jgi:hypothetical protein
MSEKSSDQSILVKNSSQKSRPYRKRKILNEQTNNDGDSEVDLETIEAVKELQKQRVRSKCFISSAVSSSTQLSNSSISEKTIRGLDSQFTLEKQEGSIEDVYMEKFIEEKMNEKRSQKMPEVPVVDNKQPKSEQRTITDEEILYSTPAHLKTREHDVSQYEHTGITNIVEVPLPDRYRIQNIIETEQARSELMQKKKIELDARRLGMLPIPLLSQRISPFFTPPSQLLDVSREEEKEQLKLERNIRREEQQLVPSATDDLVMDRFRKHWRNTARRH